MPDTSARPNPDEAPQEMFFSTSPLDDLMETEALTPPIQPGQLGSLGRYDLIRLLGRGGMGVVFQARDSRNGSFVAIKLLRTDLAQNTQAVHRFLVEAEHMVRLEHPHILPVLEICASERLPYFVLPYMAQGSLANVAAHGNPMVRNAALRIAIQMAEALDYAHHHALIHRDIKPENVLMDEDGNAFLADFGLARTFFNDSTIDVRRSHCEGTAPYMSPAVANGDAEDTRCDIYSFGAVLYQMLTGQPPYSGASSQEIRRKILAAAPDRILQRTPKAPKDLAVIAEGAMAREHRDRYANMADVLTDLQRAQRGARPLGPRGSRRYRLLFPSPRKTAMLVAVCIVILVTTLILRHALTPGLPVPFPPSAVAVRATPALPAKHATHAEFGILNKRVFAKLPGLPAWIYLQKGDWDGDGRPDLFLIHDNRLYIFSANGNIRQAETLDEHGARLSLQRVEDVDQDGRAEVFVAWAREDDAHVGVLNHHRYMVRHFTVAGHTLHTEGGITSQTCMVPRHLGDVNQDGRRELICQVNTGYGLKPRGLACFDFEDGALLWQHEFGPSPYDPIVHMSSGDAPCEIVVGSYANGNGNTGPHGTEDRFAYLFAVSPDGQRMWTLRIGDIYTGVRPHLADLDGDGQSELIATVAGNADFRPESVGLVYLFDESGVIHARYDAQAEILALRVADFNGDKAEEVVLTDAKGNLHILGALLKRKSKVRVARGSGQRQHLLIQEITDLNGDGHKEILLTNSDIHVVSITNSGERGGPVNTVHYRDNQVIVLDNQTRPLACYTVAKEWGEPRTMKAMAIDTDDDGTQEILVLCHQAIVLALAP